MIFLLKFLIWMRRPKELFSKPMNWRKNLQRKKKYDKNLQKLIPLEELSSLPEELLSTYQRLLRMTMKQKLRCALLGGKEERGILIRDPHREIGAMVLRNPKLSDLEMENFAQMRDLDSDLLRYMGNNRMFLRKYSTVLTLVKNPKTPSATSLNLLKLIREADLSCSWNVTKTFRK